MSISLVLKCDCNNRTYATQKTYDNHKSTTVHQLYESKQEVLHLRILLGHAETRIAYLEKVKCKRVVPESVKKRVAAKNNWTCAVCEKTVDEFYQIDHIIALKDGGDNETTNLQVLCRSCHYDKTAK